MQNVVVKCSVACVVFDADADAETNDSLFLICLTWLPALPTEWMMCLWLGFWLINPNAFVIYS